LVFTNDAGTGMIKLGQVGLVLNGGRIESDRFELIGTNKPLSLLPDFSFRSGQLVARDLVIEMQSGDFVVGDGENLALLQMRGGTFHFGGKCLTLSRNSRLEGIGAVSHIVGKPPGRSVQIVSAGTLAPGEPLGILEVKGTLVATGTVAIEITGHLPDVEHDVLTVREHIYLDGALNVDLLTGFRPAWTNVFAAIRWGSRTGQFTNAPPGARLPVGGGSFRVHYRPDALVLADYREDRDGDGVDDLWAETYFGHRPLSAAQRAADDDGDGLSNAAEAVAGTDPHDAASVFRIVAIIPSADGVRVRFTHVPGKWYRVWRAETMGTWREVEQPQFTYPAGGVAEWVDGRVPVSPAFYRVSVE
jgi:hypothetical protein